MKTETARVTIVFFLGFVWLLVILLNFNGIWIQITNVLFYCLSVSYVITVMPDFKFLATRSNATDSIKQFRGFIRNIYRYIFVFLSALVLFYFSVNLLYNPFKSDGEIGQCLLENGINISERGLLNITSFKIRNGRATELYLEVYVKVGHVYEKLKVLKTGGVVNCNLIEV